MGACMALTLILASRSIFVALALEVHALGLGNSEFGLKYLSCLVKTFTTLIQPIVFESRSVQYCDLL